MKPPARITVTGAAGNIGYAMLFRIASGQLLGEDRPVILQLLEITPSLGALKGVEMELLDCAFPLLEDIITTDDANVAFKNTDYAFLVGAKPRSKGMERKDLITENARIFAVQGKAINDNASPDVRVLVVGNPANTNALITASNAPDIPSGNITAMMRLDHNRAKAQIALKTGHAVREVSNMTVWGNHSATQYPDLHHCKVAGKPAITLVDHDWMEGEFIPTVQQRGAAIIEARGLSSAASAADAAIDHVRDWVTGTPDGDWVSMAVPADGSYGIEPGVMFSYPVTCSDGRYEIVQGLEINEFSQQRIEATLQELHEEKAVIADLL